MPARKKRILNIVWIVLPAAIALAAICVGRYSLSPRQVLAAFFAGPSSANKDPAVLIVYNVRLPRTILAFFVGAGLSVAGCCFQSIFSNPLASPDTLGVSSGAAFGAALGILLSLSLLGVQLFALGFGVLAIALTFLLSRLRQDSGVLMVVLAGVISSAFFNALISAAKYLADPLTKLPEITYWLMGGLDHYRYEPSLDWNADTMYQNASVSGSLDTLPERPGTLLHAKKHVGVYIGQGRVIESTTAFREAGGVQNTHISAQKWDAWFRHPLISY